MDGEQPGHTGAESSTERRGKGMDGRMGLLGKLIAATMGIALLTPVATASAAVATLDSALTGGDAEVPDPGDPNGSGAAQVTIDVKNQKLCFVIVVLDVTLPTAAAHIHSGGAGVAGDIVVTLRAPVGIGDTGIGFAKGCVRNQQRSVLRNIRSDPGAFYVNVHTSDFPGGAVRGQLEAA